MESLNELSEQSASAKLGPENKDQDALLQQTDLGSSRRDWLRSPWSKSLCEPNKEADSRFRLSSTGPKISESSN